MGRSPWLESSSGTRGRRWRRGPSPSRHTALGSWQERNALRLKPGRKAPAPPLCCHGDGLPLEVELEVSEDAPGGDEGAGHAGQDLPDAEVCRAPWLVGPRGLFDQLTVELVPQGAELLARLQDPLDDGHQVGHALQVLQRAEDFQGFVLQRGVASASWN